MALYRQTVCTDAADAFLWVGNRKFQAVSTDTFAFAVIFRAGTKPSIPKDPIPIGPWRYPRNSVLSKRECRKTAPKFCKNLLWNDFASPILLKASAATFRMQGECPLLPCARTAKSLKKPSSAKRAPPGYVESLYSRRRRSEYCSTEQWLCEQLAEIPLSGTANRPKSVPKELFPALKIDAEHGKGYDSYEGVLVHFRW